MVRQTSIIAYQTIMSNGLLSKRREQTYDYLYHYGPCTARKVSAFVTGGWKRLHELQELGVVETCGTTVCPDTNQTVLLWDVTAVIPTGSITQSKSKLAEAREELKEAKRALKDVYDLLTYPTFDGVKKRYAIRRIASVLHLRCRPIIDEDCE